jgi:hypothetical protein
MEKSNSHNLATGCSHEIYNSHNVAKGCNAMRFRTATTWRQVVAMGASPWNAMQEQAVKSRRDERNLGVCVHFAPSGL